MKSRFICIVTVIIMLVQSFVTVLVFADTETKVNIDFAGTVNIGSQYDIRSISNIVDDIQDYSFEKGQYGKSPDDVSFRMYTTGGNYAASTKILTVRNDGLPEASTGEYSHFSFQFLNENLFSNLTVRLTMQLTDGSTQWNHTLLNQPFNSSYPKHSRVFPGTSAYNWETRPAVYLDYEHKIGTWSQIDIYFSSSELKALYFINGNRAEIDLSGWGIAKPVAKIKMAEFLHGIGGSSPYKPSAVQLDNIVFEKTTSVPDSQNFRYNGETLDFDGEFSVDNGEYGIGFINSNNISYIKRFSNDTTSSSPAVKFLNPSAISLKNGAYGKPSWNSSLEILVPSDAVPGTTSMHYNPGLADIRNGDYGHMTFAVANKTDDKSCGLVSSGIKLGTLVSPDIELFEMSALNGKFKFFDEIVNAHWQKEKWYKVDILFKVGDGITSYTKADCYIDGIKYISDYEIKAFVGDYSMIESLGTLKFTDEQGSNYLIDDISLYVFSSTSYNDPSDGYVITTNDSMLKDAIDNDKKIITIAGNYRVEDFLRNISNPENVSIYNSSGVKIESGILASSVIEVSNGYGSAIYFTVETAGIVTEANLFDISDDTVLISNNSNVLNVSAANSSEPIQKLELYIDRKLYKSVNSDQISVDLSKMMLGIHEFEAYAYVNDKDCYMDMITLTLVEEKENSIIANETMESYSPGGAISGCRLVQQGGAVLGEVVTDKNGKAYGNSIVFESTKALYEGALNKHNLYMDIYTPEANMITKGVFEFDVCFLSEAANIAVGIRGKDSLTSSNTTAASYSPFTLGTTTKFNGQDIPMEINKWYNFKCMVDVNNKVSSLWIDGEAIAENVNISTNMVQMASELRMETRLPNEKYDSVDKYRFFAIDNLKFTEYDELAYIESVSDENGNIPVDYTDDTITLQMSRAVDALVAKDIILNSENGERAVKSVAIDSEDASIIYITPKYPLSSADLYSVIISPGMKSAGTLSTKTNCGIFETSAKDVDALSGEFEYKNGAMNFVTKLTNQTLSEQNLLVIAYVYEGAVFKGISVDTVTVIPGKSPVVSLELPYYSDTSKVYGLVTDNWDTLKPITNKLYSYTAIK